MKLTGIPLYPRTVRARLTLWNVIVLALAVMALAGVLRTVTARNLRASVDSELQHRSLRHLDFWANVSWASHSPPRPITHEKKSGDSVIRRFAALPPENVGQADRWRAPVAERVFNLNGVQSYPTYQGEPPWDRFGFRQAAAGERYYTELRSGGVPLRVLSVPLRRKSGEIAGVAQIASGLEPLHHALTNVDRALLMLLPIGLVAVWAAGMLLTGRALRPVRQITLAASRIGSRDLTARLPVRGQDEFSELSATMNRMLARLEVAFERQQRFTADASHELRTPLTVVKSVASRFLTKKDLSDDLRRGLERLDRAAGVMEGVVQDLLLLARSDAGQLEVQGTPLALSTVVDAALACIPASDGPVIRNEVQKGWPLVVGDASHLSRLFANLVNNAVRHTSSDGRIAISAHETGDRVLVTVADTGAGIPAEHLPHVTERFYRVDSARSRAEGGTGLGLAISQSIAEAHGGQLKIESVEGEGTTITVDLPSASDSASSLRVPPCTSESSAGRVESPGLSGLST